MVLRSARARSSAINIIKVIIIIISKNDFKEISCVLKLLSDFGPVQKTCMFVIQNNTFHFRKIMLYWIYVLTQLHCNLLSVPQPSRYDIQEI